MVRLYPKTEVKRTLRQGPTAAKRLTLTPEQKAFYAKDPVAYARDVLGEDLYEAQQEILCSLVENARTRAQASHAVGKTHVASIACRWWYDTSDEHIVYITAPTWKQALGLTFKYVVRISRRCGLPGRILKSGLLIDEDPLKEGEHFIQAINAESGEGFQGEHSAPILLILEEAVGVPSYIWEAADGLMTHPECRLLAIGNPTNANCEFGETATDSELYHTITISALDHPNISAEIKGEEPPYPKAVRLSWLYTMLRKECEVTEEMTADHFEWYALEDVKEVLRATKAGAPTKPLHALRRCIYRPNAVFQGRVLGMFPTAPDEQVIPLAWLRQPPGTRLVPQGDLSIGVDVALMGADRTVITACKGAIPIMMVELRQMDTNVITGRVVQLAEDLATAFTVDAKDDIIIKVDVTGGLGAGPMYRLQELGYLAVGINSSSGALAKGKFPNRRSEMWFTARELAYHKEIDLSYLPEDARKTLEKELTSPTWAPDSQGRKVVEPKIKMKQKNNGRSPDAADSYLLAVAGIDPAEIEALKALEAAFEDEYDYADPEDYEGY